MKKGLQQFNMKSGSVTFPARNGKCKVVLNSRFLLTSDQISKIKDIVDQFGFDTPSHMNTVLVKVSLFLMEWFPKEYNHVTVSGELPPHSFGKKDCLTITIS